MHRISRKMILVVVAVGALAAGGAAFTAGNTVPAQIVGYGSAAVTGATVQTIHDTLTPDGGAITSVRLVMADALPDNAVVTAGYSDETPGLDACATTDAGTTWDCPVLNGQGGTSAAGVVEPVGSELVLNATQYSVAVTQ
jgi:hypothetical protein